MKHRLSKTTRLKFTLSEPDAKQSAAGFAAIAIFALPLGWNDIVTLE